MEKVLTRCPHCNTSMAIKNKNVLGKKIRCPKCSTPFVVMPIEQTETKRSLTETEQLQIAAAPIAQTESKKSLIETEQLQTEQLTSLVSIGDLEERIGLEERKESLMKSAEHQVSENLSVSEKFREEQHKTLQYFEGIATEYTRKVKYLASEHQQKQQNISDDIEKQRRDLKGQLNQITDNVDQAKDSLQRHYKSVMHTFAKGEHIVDGVSEPEVNIAICIKLGRQTASEIKKLCRKTPTPIGGIAFGVFVFSWIIFGIMAESLGGGFYIALIATTIISIAVYNLRISARRHPFQRLLQLQEDANVFYNIALKDIEEQYTDRMNLAEGVYETSLQKVMQEFDQNMVKVYQFCEKIRKQIDSCSPAWNDESWQQFILSTTLPSLTRMGEFTSGRQIKTTLKEHQFSMPALLPFPGKEAVLFLANDQGKTIVAQQIKALLLRLLATIPPAKLRFTFIDPVALGQNVAPFMHLSDYDELLVTSKAWSEPKHIEKRLEELTEHMETVIQKYLRNTYATIEEFNQHAGEVAEAYRFLVVLNFPVNFSDDATRRLVSIVQNGPRCGVHTIILYDTKQELPYGFNIHDLEQFSMPIHWDGYQFTWKEPKSSCKCIFALEAPPDENMFNTIIKQVGKAAVAASKVKVPFEKVLERSELENSAWWKGTTREGMSIPLGPIGANKIQYLEFGKGTAHHALVAGKTGSGKSTLLHVLIGTLALKYSPDEIELYLIDFKKGVEFKVYSTYKLPHARVIAIESEREFGLSVLEGLDAELTRRGELCREAEVGGLEKYRQITKKKMPRILLLVDEFQEFFTYDDPIASKASQILDRLVRQGRAFGIHILLGSQTLSGAYTLARSTIDQMAIRIALQCSEADSRLILSDDNPAARTLSRPGEAIYNSANGLIEGNNPFQVAWLSEKQEKHYLEQVAMLGKKTGHFPPRNQIVFEGNAPVEVAKNIPLATFLLKTQRLTFVRRAEAWLGEPIAIKDATTARFLRQSGSNLLIVGQNDEAVAGMLSICLLSLSAQYQSESARFYLLDFGSVDAPHAHILNSLSGILPHPMKYGRRRHLPDIINMIAREVEIRLEHEEESLEKKASIYLIIHGLQRARDLEQDSGLGFDYSAPPPSFGESDEFASPPPANPGKQFSTILREGPELGIHTIVWCDTTKNLQRRLDRQALREFEMRVVLQMSNDDSLNLIDSPAASKLGEHRALFYSEEEGRLEKFRPFALPHERWLKKIGEKLQEIA